MTEKVVNEIFGDAVRDKGVRAKLVNPDQRLLVLTGKNLSDIELRAFLEATGDNFADYAASFRQKLHDFSHE